MSLKWNERFTLLVVIIVLTILNIYGLYSRRKIAEESIAIKRTYHEPMQLIESLEASALTHILATKGIDIADNLIDFDEPKLVMAYNDLACTPCIANELENIKEFFSPAQLKHIVIIPQTRDKASFLTLLRAHRLDNLLTIYADHEELSMPVSNAGGFLVYFLYQPGKKPEMVYYPLTGLPALTFRYFEMVKARTVFH
jgi:hypothetical protein